MIEDLLQLFDRGLDYARRLVADVPDDQMADQPAAGMNHPAWTLGHLAGAADVVLAALGRPTLHSSQWKSVYGRESHPLADRSLYADKAELLAALTRAHEAVAQALREIDPKALEAASPEPYAARFPTKWMLVIQMTSGHEMTHLGQLSAWRRVRGMKAV